jgi:N-acetyl sugar amidotransferase
MTTCRQCVMDTTDPDITFDATGLCHHCRAHARGVLRLAHQRQAWSAERVAASIHRRFPDHRYQVVIGLSGGVDSSYTALRVADLGLRALAVHFDNGWNSGRAVDNMRRVLDATHFPLVTHVAAWEEFADLQRSFLLAGVPDLEIPTDHALVALLYQEASRHRVPVIISGCNHATETHLPPAWSQGHRDWVYLQTIHRRFGRVPLRTYPHQDRLTQILDRRRTRWIDLLDHLDYRKEAAQAELSARVGWRPPPAKHGESVFTRLYQRHLLPLRFGYDKRRAHLSSLICSGQLQREEALQELAEPLYVPADLAEDLAYLARKLDWSPAELQAILAGPRRTREEILGLDSRWGRLRHRLTSYGLSKVVS